MPIHDLTDEDVTVRAAAAARTRWPDAAVSGVRRLEGGVSSLTYAAVVTTPDGPGDVVLKIAPPGLEPVRNRDVLRQARILDALGGLVGFPVPEVLLRDAGEPPAVPPMFAMELRPGQAYEPLLDVSPTPPTASEVAAREHALARALARMHTPTPEQLGVADEAVVTAAAELQRWRTLLETVDGDLAPGHEGLWMRLAERVPADIAPRIVHGDYRAANALFVGADLEAVIDWEIWSVGDPRPDLAWLLMHTAPAHVFHPDRSEADLEAGRLMPSAQDLLTSYLGASREGGATAAELADVTTDLAWFLGVAHYKVAATIAVIWKRERRRLHPDPKLAYAAARLSDVLVAGHAALDGARPGGLRPPGRQG